MRSFCLMMESSNDIGLNLIDFDAQVSTKDVSEESASYIWFSLLKDVLIQLPQYEKSSTTEYVESDAKIDMIDSLRSFYADNPAQLTYIDEFSEAYHRKEMAVHFYSRNGTIHKPINTALRTKDIDALVKYRYFISHLSNDLRDR